MTTKNPVTVKPGSSVADAARLMKQHDVGALVVRDEQEILGLVTDRDIVVRAVATGKEGTKAKVEDVYSGELHTVSPDEPIERAIEQMRSQAVRRVPVVQSDQAVGIRTIGDLAIERDERSALADISAAAPNG